MSVSKFCYKNDFSTSILNYFSETSTCISQSISNASKKCFDDNLADELSHMSHENINLIPNRKLEMYTKCLLTNLKCSIEVKKFFAINLLANYPKIIQGNLETYVQQMITTNTEMNPTLIGK